MAQKSQHGKSPAADLFGMTGVSRQIARTAPTCRAYAKELHSRGTPGVFRVDNGDYVVNSRGIAAMREELALRAERMPGGALVG